MTHDLAAMRITQATEDQVMALFSQIEALLPGMVNLPADANGMAPKSESYVRITMDLANQNADMIPPYVDLASANADLEARDRMLRITQRVQQFGGKCELTTFALGRHLMVFAQVCCAILKLLGKSAGLDEGVKDLGYYRSAQPRTKPALVREDWNATDSADGRFGHV